MGHFFKSAVLSAVAVFALSTPALALRCATPNLVQTFENVRQDAPRRMIGLGVFELDPDWLARNPLSDGEFLAMMPAIFTGQILGPDGFEPTPPFAVTLNTTNIGPWPGHPPQMGVERLAFFTTLENSISLQSGPCGSDAYAIESAEERHLIETMTLGERP